MISLLLRRGIILIWCVYAAEILSGAWMLIVGDWEKSAVKNVFIRGSVVRYVHLPANAVDTALLEDATRRGMATR